MTTLTVPYITTWSTEQDLPATVINHSRAGIAYADETLSDRDENGILWTRIASRPGHGRPQFGKVHSLRQRRAVRKLLCQVCGNPADRTHNGTLWLLQDHRDDWPHWPENMAATEPPICLPCAHISRRACPALRRSHISVRVGHSTLSGIYGILYQTADPLPQPITDVTLPFTDPAIPWTRAGQLVRQLHNCTIVNLDDEASR